MNSVRHPSPVGTLTLVSDAGALIGCEVEGRTEPRGTVRRTGSDPVLELARRELDAFFEGALREFTVPVAPRGTDFQRRVWSALRTIPYGQTTSYGSIAARIGSPEALRSKSVPQPS